MLKNSSALELLPEPKSVDVNPLIVQLTHLPFPEVANTLRAVADEITLAWDAAVRQAMPQMKNLTFDELKDSTPQILLAIADALASDDPDVIRELVSHAPAQGLSRLRLHFDVVEVMQEDRLLRAITVQHVEAGLGRQMNVAESAALHAAIDVMLQRSVIALVDEQKSQLRAAAETELKFLSFLTHDLNNNLFSISLLLSAHAMDLKQTGQFGEAQASLSLAQKSIDDTVSGMRRMLDQERLRQSAKEPTLASVDLYEIGTVVAWQFKIKAAEQGIKLVVDVLPKTFVESDGEIITVVLQNLVGNAVKYSTGGTVRIGSDENLPVDRRALWVTDEGPGIASDKMHQIFDAFRRGEVHGQLGVGLGLAIASQGAKLLGAELSVASKLGVGSSFHLVFPPNATLEKDPSELSFVKRKNVMENEIDAPLQPSLTAVPPDLEPRLRSEIHIGDKGPYMTSDPSSLQLLRTFLAKKKIVISFDPAIKADQSTRTALPSWVTIDSMPPNYDLVDLQSELDKEFPFDADVV